MLRRWSGLYSADAPSIQNFKALEDVHLEDLPSMSVFLGRNGTGKTTLFRVFSFLQECLHSNARIAPGTSA